jgi:hypothetical protein
MKKDNSKSHQNIYNLNNFMQNNGAHTSSSDDCEQRRESNSAQRHNARPIELESRV